MTKARLPMGDKKVARPNAALHKGKEKGLLGPPGVKICWVEERAGFS